MFWEKICRSRKCTGVSFSGVPGIVFSSPWCGQKNSLISVGILVCEAERERGRETERGVCSYQLVEDAGIERLFEPPAVPELLVVVVQALPVHAEVLGTVVVDVVEPVSMGNPQTD